MPPIQQQQLLQQLHHWGQRLIERRSIFIFEYYVGNKRYWVLLFCFFRKGIKKKRKVKRKSRNKHRKGSKGRDQQSMFRSKRMQRKRPKMHIKRVQSQRLWQKWKGRGNLMSNKPRQLKRRRRKKKQKRKLRMDRFFLPG